MGPAGEGSSQVPGSPEQPATAEQTPGVFEAQDLGAGSEALCSSMKATI